MSKTRIDCTIIQERPRGIEIETRDGVQRWLPLSAAHEIHRDGENSYVIVDSWLAAQEGLA